MRRLEARPVRLACGAGWSRDRYEPALELVRNGHIDYLCFDAMSEVTMSAAQVARLEGQVGPLYDPSLLERMEPLLAECKQRGIKIITNAGWLDPRGAADMVRGIAARQNIEGLRVASVEGGILTDTVADMGLHFVETAEPVELHRDRIVSAETYLGAEGIVEALRRGADVVITTRVADGCIFLAPLVHALGWSLDDPQLAAKGMVVGHLLECGSQISGGYFADPGYKDVPNLIDVGNPIAEVSNERILITKVQGSGGLVTEATCKEQLLYEVQDPSRYMCPDVVVDLTRVSFREVAKDCVEVHVDGAGLPRTATLKVLVGLTEGFMTEEMVLFAGPGALEKARMTESLLRERLVRAQLCCDDMRIDYIGLNSIHREASPEVSDAPYEVVLRIALKAQQKGEVEKLRREVDPLAVNGVAGTGKWTTASPGSRVRTVVGLSSVLVPRELISWRVDFS